MCQSAHQPGGGPGQCAGLHPRQVVPPEAEGGEGEGRRPGRHLAQQQLQLAGGERGLLQGQGGQVEEAEEEPGGDGGQGGAGEGQVAEVGGPALGVGVEEGEYSPGGGGGGGAGWGLGLPTGG